MWQESDLKVILNTVSYHVNIKPIKAEIDQLMEGLEVFHIGSLMKRHQKELRSLFVYSMDNNPLSVSLLLALCSDVRYSESNRRSKEEATVQFFNQFIIEIGAGMISEKICYFCIMFLILYLIVN